MKRDRGALRRFLRYQARQKGLNLFCGGIFLLGMILGCEVYSLCGDEALELLGLLEPGLLEAALWQRARQLFLPLGLELGLLCFCGFCAIGQPVALLALLYRGLGLGLSATYLAAQGREAFGYYLLVLLPQSLLTLLLEVVAVRESWSFSLSFFRQLWGNPGPKGLSVSPRVYCVRFGLLFVLGGLLSLGCAALEGLLRPWII